MPKFFHQAPRNAQYFPDYSPKQPKNRPKEPPNAPFPQNTPKEKSRQQPGTRLPFPQAEGAVDPGSQAPQAEYSIGQCPVP